MLRQRFRRRRNHDSWQIRIIEESRSVGTHSNEESRSVGTHSIGTYNNNKNNNSKNNSSETHYDTVGVILCGSDAMVASSNKNMNEYQNQSIITIISINNNNNNTITNTSTSSDKILFKCCPSWMFLRTIQSVGVCWGK